MNELEFYKELLKKYIRFRYEYDGGKEGDGICYLHNIKEGKELFTGEELKVLNEIGDKL